MVNRSQVSPRRAAASEFVRLRDGAGLEIRPMVPGDRAGLAAAIARLSDRTRYLRFAAPMPRVGDRELDLLLDIDHRHREALLALEPSSRAGIAVARYAEIVDEPGAVDLALTVDDAWQGRGLGSLLLKRILARACENGYEAARGSVLAENRRSRALLRSAGFTVRGRAGLLIELERGVQDTSWLCQATAS